jgi:hypothetical protein
MSVRLIARDLYRLIDLVEKLNKEIEIAPAAKQGELLEQLRKAVALRDQLRRALDGSKNGK